MKKIRGIRKRWMVNSISVVLFVVLLAVTAFSAAMGSYFYTTMGTNLQTKAESAINSFSTGEIISIVAFPSFTVGKSSLRRM